MVITPGVTADTMAIIPDRSSDAAGWPHGMVIRPAGPDSVLSALFRPIADALLVPAPVLL